MKRAQIIWSNEALNDLETIYDFLKGKSQSTAQQIVESILGRCRQLELFPESGSKQETTSSTTKEYRFLVEGHYKIIYSYQWEIQTVHIAVVFDTRYDPEKLSL